MLKKVIFLHVVPIIIAFMLVFLSYTLVKSHFNTKVSTEIVQGIQIKFSGLYPNLNDEPNAELQYIASIKNKNQLTLFGSSEFSDSAVVPYFFLPDSLGFQTIGIGHAYHQELSILVELLAAHKFNEGSKICIFLSPGWFIADGTNVQAFIEFARPNFLKSIINNDSIPLKYKRHIGRFIDTHSGDIENMSKVMSKFVDMSKICLTHFFNSILNKYFGGEINTIDKVNYEVVENNLKPKAWEGDFDLEAKRLQTQFINRVTSNKMYVYDDYYKKYVIDENGNERSSIIEPIDFKKNNEYADFKLLVEYIKDRKMNASFVLIPFNPYYYKNTEILKPLIDSVSQTLTKNQIPFYNLYVTNRASYEPGILKDVMHIGNYGWMKINKYLYNLYVKHEK